MGGKLYTLEYGDISSLSANPIEKKPFFHFFPGSHALTVGSWSCNFTYPWCQNWEISKYLPDREKRNNLSRRSCKIDEREEMPGNEHLVQRVHFIIRVFPRCL
jgi:pyruvate-formate lyase-activating enzyme